MGLRAGEGKGGRGQMGKEPRPLLPCGLHGASQGQGQAAWGGGRGGVLGTRGNRGVCRMLTTAPEVGAACVSCL